MRHPDFVSFLKDTSYADMAANKTIGDNINYGNQSRN